LLAAGRGAIENFPKARSPVTEAIATWRVAKYAHAIDAPVYFVHLSCREALDAVRNVRREGAEIYVETRPVYLYLDETRYALPEGGKYVCLPPLRSESDQKALWEGLRNGEIQTYATDHAPWPAAKKLSPNKSFFEIPAGVSNLQTTIGMLYSEGVRKGRISLNQFVAVASTNPAKLFGLWPKKGTLSVGADADLVLIDPNKHVRVTVDDMESKVDYDPYEGFECDGWPVLTMSRGEVIFADGKIKSRPGRGQFLRRSRYLPL
jgi:dihydropyrimidinase